MKAADLFANGRNRRRELAAKTIGVFPGLGDNGTSFSAAIS